MDRPARSASCRLHLVLVAAALAAWTASAAARPQAQSPPDTVHDAEADGDSPASDGPTYAISELDIRYLRENPLHPSIDDAMQVPITLGTTETGYVAPRPGVPEVSITLASIATGETELYHASAIQRILEVLRDHYIAEDLLGVYLAPDPRQISETGQDLRAEGETRLYIVVTTGIVTELRTIGSGERTGERGEIAAEDRINNAIHARIADDSPFHPFTRGDVERSDLLRKSMLDRFLFHLGRHPGRRVDASVSAAEEIGGIALDYMVTENRPLTLYAQIANTGTRSTDRLRERFGFFHTQLTNTDDILSLDYTTASFDQVHSVVGSYERPFPGNDRLRWRVFGGWSEYTATEVGFFNDIFRGQSWNIGGEVAWNFYQQRELFIDLVGGLRFDSQEVDNRAFAIQGDESFILPSVGLRLDRTTEWFSTNAALFLEWQLGDVTDVDGDELVALGRVDPDADWALLKWNVSHSFYLEPLMDHAAWEDPTTPESSTLAHEIFLQFRGQYAFGNRLIPQYQQVVGGLYTVRGYPESVVAGDTMLIGTAEYRFHVPRAFDLKAEPGELFGRPFRAAPQYVYGTPDWDLVLKAFCDVGRSVVHDDLFFEDDDTLVGAGIGFDLLYRRNLNLRVDWGFALEDLARRDVNSGSNRLQFVVTILY